MTTQRTSAEAQELEFVMPSTSNEEMLRYLEQVADAVEHLQRAGLDFAPPTRLREVVARLNAAFSPDMRSSVPVRSVPIAAAIRMLIRPGGSVTTKTLRRRLRDAGVDASPGAVSMALTRAVQGGELQRTAPGRYYRPEIHPDAPSDHDHPEQVLGQPDHGAQEQPATPSPVSPNDTDVTVEQLLRKYVDEYGEIIVLPKEAGQDDGQAPSEAVVGM